MSETKDTIAFRTKAERRKRLDKVAALQERDRTFVLNEAIDAYLDHYDWQTQVIQKGLAEANDGRFATDEESAAVFARARVPKPRRKKGA